MRIRLLSAVFAAALTAGLATGSVTAASAQASNSPSIIGGETVESAPWGVQVSNNHGGFCSGSIIAAQWVLTASHCLRGATSVSVKVGDVRLGQGVPAQGSEFRTQGDTGLVHLTTAVTTTYAPLAEADPPVGAIVEIYGWGGISQRGPLAQKLKRAQVRVTRFNDADTERRIRAVKVTGTAWHGDSGGPMFYQGVQIGTCTGQAGDELIYPSVAKVRSWIRDTTGV